MPITESGLVWALFSAIGIPLLFLLFYLDGLVIGKVGPPAALFVAYVTIASPSQPTLAFVGVGSAVASTLGQWTLYRGFNDDRPELVGLARRLPIVRRVPLVVRDRLGERRLGIISRLFDRFGGASIGLTNAVPGIRSLITIPAGLTRYPVERFLLYSLLGNLLYVTLLTGVGLGLVEVFRYVPWP